MARRPSKSLIVLVVVVLVAAAGVILLRVREHDRVADAAHEKARQADLGPKVFVAPVQQTPPERDVTLPGEVRAFFLTTLYAKVPGYLKEIRVDKGDSVKEGELLATIESPETDREILGAQTDLDVKRRLHARLGGLLHGNYVAPQEVENAASSMNLAKSVLERLKVLQQYEKVTAPFDGLITGRYVDPGAMIPEAKSGTESLMPIVDIADVDLVRIAVFVSQDVSGLIGAKTPVTITQDSPPRFTLNAEVTRTAGAVDPRSRTMLCEIWLDNKKRQFQPGTFLQVTFHLKAPPLPTVPSESLFVRKNEQLAAIVRGRRVHFTQIRPGIDDGAHVEVLDGLKVGEQVAVNMPADLEDGAAIQPVAQSAPPGETPKGPLP